MNTQHHALCCSMLALDHREGEKAWPDIRMVKRAPQAWQQHHTPSPHRSTPQAASAAAPQAANAARAPEQKPSHTPASQASLPARLDQVYLDQAASTEQMPPTEIAPAPPAGTEAKEASAPPDAVQWPEPPPRPAPSPPPQAQPAGSLSIKQADAAAATLSNTRDASVGCKLPLEIVASEPTVQSDAGETEAAWVRCNHRADVQ